MVVNTPQGRYRIFLFDQFISKPLFVHRDFESQDIDRVAGYLETRRRKFGVGVFVDIGANIGIIGLSFLVRGISKRAILIEPSPQNFHALKENVLLNRQSENVVCFQCGASDAEGTAAFELSADNSGDHRVRTPGEGKPAPLMGEERREVISIRLAALDSIVREALPDCNVAEVEICWIDVQGHEGAVIRGGQSLWKAKVPAYAEICPYMLCRNGETREGFCELLADTFLRYAVWRRGRFCSYPIELFYLFWDELGDCGDFENVLFLHE